MDSYTTYVFQLLMQDGRVMVMVAWLVFSFIICYVVDMFFDKKDKKRYNFIPILFFLMVLMILILVSNFIFIPAIESDIGTDLINILGEETAQGYIQSIGIIYYLILAFISAIEIGFLTFAVFKKESRIIFAEKE